MRINDNHRPFGPAVAAAPAEGAGETGEENDSGGSDR